MVKLFPHCFELQSRIKFFYHAIEIHRSHERPLICIHVRRNQIIEDGIRVFRQMLLQDQLHSRIKVRFIDEHGVQEVGHDDGGLFKEFLISLMKEVSSPPRLFGFWV